MDKQIFIINGSGGSGKDTFVKYIKHFMYKQFKENVWTYDSVWRIKRFAREIGWDGRKTEKDRKFLAELKKILVEYNDNPFNDIKKQIKKFNNNDSVFLFIHIREPNEIKRVVEMFGAKTILIKRNNIEQITSNTSDANVEEYLSYDYIIENDGTLKELKEKAEKFIIGIRSMHEEFN